MKADTVAEFLRSYAGSWVGLKLGTKVVPAQIASREATPDHVAFKYNTGPEGKQLSKDVSWQGERDSIVRGFPDLGMLSLGPTVGYINTMPRRQWHKGYYPQNVRMWVPNIEDLQSVAKHVRFTPSHPAVLWQLFNREYWHPGEALRLLTEGEGTGYPLSINFGTYIKADVECPLLCYKTHMVGSYNEGRWELLNTHKAYKEQFKRETGVEAH